jgi:hypothetical protein
MAEGGGEVGTVPSGVTQSERYLKRLCDRTFLALWSHANVFRDQGAHRENSQGKELADLLVVFDEHILIFSDKSCAFPDTGTILVDWNRWFQKAIVKSVDQVSGAERWIKKWPRRLFLDPKCTSPFPFTLPPGDRAKFHRIVVAHNSSTRCRVELGRGSGSLIIDTRIEGVAHRHHPFRIGHLDRKRGFVHVLDDFTLQLLLRELDTVADLTRYLERKEQFLLSLPGVVAHGEEQLLAFYLPTTGADGRHAFHLPREAKGQRVVVFPDQHWPHFEASAERHARISANRVSYAWDQLIDRFGAAATSAPGSADKAPALTAYEPALRRLAAESRTRRRLFSAKLHELAARTPENEGKALPFQALTPRETAYVFARFPAREQMPLDDYRERCRELLGARCEILKLTNPSAQHVVGIGVPARADADTGEMLVYLDATHWSLDREKRARRLQREHRVFWERAWSTSRILEYPSLPPPTSAPRNSPCPCGSGRKFKRCCLARFDSVRR